MRTITLPLASDLPFGNIRTRFEAFGTITSNGAASVDGQEATAFYAGAGTVLFLTFEGATQATIEDGRALDDLDLAALQGVVNFLNVDTSAQTAAGLRRAIERHLEEAG